MTQFATRKFNVSNHAHVIKGTEKCLTKWFYLFYNHRAVFSHLTRQGAGRYKLNKAALKVLPIASPSIEEPSEIIIIIDTCDKSIETLTQLITQKQQKKKALMQQLLSGKKRFPEFGDKWEEVHLGDVFKERNDLKLLAITSSNGVVNRDTLEKRDTSNKDKSKYKRIVVGDIGYNTMRLWQGVAALSGIEGIVSSAYTIVIPQKNVEPVFMSYLFKLPKMIHTFFRYSQGLVDDTRNCKFNHFAQIKVVIPSKKEQQKIAAILQTIDKEIETLQQKLQALKKQKKGLMQQLLTGKKRVKL